jgi:phosphoserine phosphatase
MAVTNLYFVRHGETDYNKNHIVQGRRINGPLNVTGRAQARALARRFAELDLSAIYSSTLIRAEETASIIAAEHPGVPVYRLKDLEEMSWGVFEGQAFSKQVAEVFAQLVRPWEMGDFSIPIEGGESILDVQQRGLRAVKHIVSRHPGETVVVVTHGRFLRVMLATLLTEYGLERMQEIAHANTSVNHLILENELYTAKLLNCTAHLDEAEALVE